MAWRCASRLQRHTARTMACAPLKFANHARACTAHARARTTEGTIGRSPGTDVYDPRPTCGPSAWWEHA
eukprot:3384356-Prymnesium_polylepis.1